MTDPHGLLYCAEADLDKVLLRSPEMYASFVDTIEWVLREGMTTETVSTIADRQLRDMWGVLSDDDTAAGPSGIGLAVEATSSINRFFFSS